MGKVTFDKKQIPQVLGLGALSLGLFGWFGWKMITPPPTQAAAVVAPSTTSAAGSTTAAAANGKTGSGPDAADMSPDVAALIGAAAPTDDMRDPFVPGVIESAVKPAAPGAPGMPGLPSIGQVRPLPLPTAAPQLASWTVTGVICSDADPSAAIAILRSGDERRYIRLGNMVDEATRLIGVDRGGVTILRSSDRIRLPLGGVIADPTVKKPELAQPTGAFDPASSAGLASVTGSQPQSKTPAADSVPALPSLVPSAPPAPASAAEQTAPPPGAHPA